MINFKNKKILITGATGGIGNELVKKFSDLGGSIVATGTKSEKLDVIKKKYPNVKIQKFDISEHSRIEEFIDWRFSIFSKCACKNNAYIKNAHKTLPGIYIHTYTHTHIYIYIYIYLCICLPINI